MRGLMRLRRRENDDSGAVAVMVAVLLTGGVLIGAAALVIDVGGLYAKREQLQSGADAAAWAIAEDCIGTDGTCAPDTLQALADDMMAAQIYGPGEGSNTSAAAAAQYCVSWQDCTVAWDTDVGCPRDRLTFADSVEVRTHYRDGDRLIMPAPLAGAFSGEPRGARIGACSRVTWGAPESLPVTALGIAESCVEGQPLYRADLDAEQRERLGLVPLRSLPDVPDGFHQTFPAGGTDPCALVPVAGEQTGPDCRIEPTPRGQVTTSEDPARAAACEQSLAAATGAREPVLVPVYNTDAPVPDPDEGNIYGEDDESATVAAVTAVTVVGFAALQPVAKDNQCADGTCLDGYLTRVLAPRSQPRFSSDGARDFGVTVIGRTG